MGNPAKRQSHRQMGDTPRSRHQTRGNSSNMKHKVFVDDEGHWEDIGEEEE